MKYLKRFWPIYLLTGLVAVVTVGWGSRSVTVLAENAPSDKTVFIIDAGHGGVDGGATSVSGVLESAINLEIALKLNDLMHLLGMETKMIRTTDMSVYTEGSTISAQKVSDLKNRVKTVNDTQNAILISIHQNTFPQGKYSGAQVFYNDSESKAMAQALQNALISSVNPGSTRKCKQAKGVYLMEHIQKPGVLIECGFLSNSVEDQMLQDKGYQQKLCCVIASVFSQMLSNT